MTYCRRWAALLAWCALVASALAQSREYPQTPDDTADSDFGPRPSFMSRVGNGIGYQSGYNRLEGFIPLRQEAGDFLSFGDMRFMELYQGQFAGSLGLGHRVFSDEFDRTFGAYLYGDAREDPLATFGQISGGVETLGRNWDFRSNFYVPMANRTAAAQTFTPMGTPYLQGNNILAYGSRRYDQTMAGWDATLAMVVYSNIRVFGGAYYFTGAGTPDAIGGRAGVDVQLRNYANANLALQSDRVFGTNVLFGLTFSWPGNRNNPHRTDIDVRNRLADSPQKQDLIVVSQQTRQANYAYTDPQTGAPIQVIYVSQAATPGGNGTFEHPFQTLAQAQNVLTPNEKVFVENGTYYDTITLQPYDSLLGDGTAHTVYTQEGNILFPQNTPGAMPTIFNVNGAAITLGTSTAPGTGDVVSGMIVNGNGQTSSAGISGDNANDLVITKNTISTVSDGVDLTGPSGTNVIAGNNVTSSGSEAIHVTSNGTNTETLTVANNTVSSAGNDGIRLEINTGSVMNANVTGNTVTIASGGNNGINIEGDTTSGTTSMINIANNTVNASNSGTHSGIIVQATSGSIDSTINNNTLNMAKASDSGVEINPQGSSQIGASITNNNVSGTYANGVLLTTTDSGTVNPTTISGNTFTGTYTNGVSVSDGTPSSITATISGNTVTDPTSAGVSATQTSTGAVNLTVSGNTFTQNAGTAGVFFNPAGAVGSTFTGNVSGNTFNLSNAGVNALQVTTANGDNATVSYTNNTTTGTYNDGGQFTSGDNSVLSATATGNTFVGTFQHGFEITSNDFSLLSSMFNNNAVAGAASDGMVMTANNFSNLMVSGSGNSVTAGATNGINVVVNDNANVTSTFNNNPNVVGNNTSATPGDYDINETTNGGVLTTTLNNNAGFSGGPHGTIGLTNNAGIFNVTNDPVADNPNATVTVGPGVNTNTGS